MAVTVAEIEQSCERLREIQAQTLSRMSQAEVVSIIADWARLWHVPSFPWRRAAEALTEPFPFAMTRTSLDALLESLTSDALWGLIDAEDVRDASGPALIGHVIAGNTPLLAWVSILRALLMRSASFVKLPSGASAEWAHLFLNSLAEVSPCLASAVQMARWTGGERALDAALCRQADLILAYGSTQTITTLQALCAPATRFVGYGHRVSLAVVGQGASFSEAASGLAQDVLLYDQGGCLSPHTVFVQGGPEDVLEFAAQFAEALGKAVADFPQTPRTPPAAMRVREARLLASMESGTRLWEDAGLCWTVIARSQSAFALSPTHGVVSVQPLDNIEDLPTACAPVHGYLQGCALAVSDSREWGKVLEELGVSWICRPGKLQAPPFSWREDGSDVLRSLTSVSETC